jgi:hypothetical protein
MAREGATEINILCQVNKTHLWPKRKKTKQNKNSSSCGNWLDSTRQKMLTWGYIYIYRYNMGVYLYICNNQQHKFIYINSSHGPTAIHNSKLGFLSSHVHLQRYEHGEQQKNVKKIQSRHFLGSRFQ